MERKLLEAPGQADELRAFFHDGFWQPIDTLRDRVLREEQWSSGKAKWKCGRLALKIAGMKEEVNG